MAGKLRSKGNLGLFSKAVLLVNVFAVAALFISYLAPMVDPKSFWPVAFFGIGYLPILLVNVMFVVYWAIRRPRYVTISLMAILTGWGHFCNHFGFSATVPAEVVANPDTSHIRVLTYNVHFFRKFNQKETELTISKEAMQLIDSLSPDIVCVQEYYTRKKGKYKMTTEFERKVGTVYHHFSPTAENDYEAYGVAIFSRYPIVATGQLAELEHGVNQLIYADIDKGGKIFRVYSVHLRSFEFQEEDYEFINKPKKSIEMDAVSTRRIGSRLKHAFIARSTQAEALRKHSWEAGLPFIIAGDFNDTPLSYAVNTVSSASVKNAFREKGHGWGVTYNGDFPNFQIDYILASVPFKVHNYQIVKAKLSDHYPVWADLEL